MQPVSSHPLACERPVAQRSKNVGRQSHARLMFHQNHVAENMSPVVQLYTLIYV
jgi:hypothetical protein